MFQIFYLPGIPKGLTLKQDLSPRERAIDKILMKEQQLIRSGQNRKDIKCLAINCFLEERFMEM